jgi:DNA-binding NarL/FixJ family response regulator
MILVVGDLGWDEFRDLAGFLEAAGALQTADSARAALSQCDREALEIDVIVLAQSYPGQFVPHEIDRLRRRWPLARVVVVGGSWCGGETRSGQPLSATLRMAWHQAPLRFARELRRLGTRGASTWALPVTASEEEKLLADAQNPLPSDTGLVAVYAPTCARYAWLSEVLRAGGLATTWIRPGNVLRIDGATAAVFDADECEADPWEDLCRLVRSLPRVAVVVLMDFPRAEDRHRLLAAGAASVLGKPVLLDDLFEAILRPRTDSESPRQ